LNGEAVTQSPDILRQFHNGGVLFDGGIGTMLIAMGLQPGMPPEEWNRTHPSEVRRIHTGYLEAGADVIETNTFGGTPSRMKSFGLADAAADLNNAAIRLAKEAVEEFRRHHFRRKDREFSHTPRFTALSLGPTGKMMPPVGDATDDEIKTEFRGQLEGIHDTFDLILIETMFDLRESLLALEIAKEIKKAPVAVTLTFNQNPRGFFTVMGNEAAEAMATLGGAGADIVGANCTLTSVEMTKLARVLRDSTDLPVLCQPNAGQPTIRDGVPVYEQTPREYADDMSQLFDIGINAVGGCCGTTPEFIRELFHRRGNKQNRDTKSTI
jgi:5-methyltetrahydrofolate--homocysteine methyltransferase